MGGGKLLLPICPLTDHVPLPEVVHVEAPHETRLHPVERKAQPVHRHGRLLACHPVSRGL